MCYQETKELKLLLCSFWIRHVRDHHPNPFIHPRLRTQLARNPGEVCPHRRIAWTPGSRAPGRQVTVVRMVVIGGVIVVLVRRMAVRMMVVIAVVIVVVVKAMVVMVVAEHMSS